MNICGMSEASYMIENYGNDHGGGFYSKDVKEKTNIDVVRNILLPFEEKRLLVLLFQLPFEEKRLHVLLPIGDFSMNGRDVLECKIAFNQSNLVHQDYNNKIVEMTKPKKLGCLEAYEKTTLPWFKVVDIVEGIFEFTCTAFPFVAVMYFYLQDCFVQKGSSLPIGWTQTRSRST